MEVLLLLCKLVYRTLACWSMWAVVWCGGTTYMAGSHRWVQRVTASRV